MFLLRIIYLVLFLFLLLMSIFVATVTKYLTHLPVSLSLLLYPNIFQTNYINIFLVTVSILNMEQSIFNVN